MGLCIVSQNYRIRPLYMPWQKPKLGGVTRRRLLSFFLGIYLFASAVGNSHRLSYRELPLCWTLSPLLAQQICVDCDRGYRRRFGSRSGGVKDSTARRSIRRRVVVVWSSSASREVRRPPSVATGSSELSSDRSQEPRVILHTFYSKEDPRRATSSNHLLNLGSADSPLSPGGSVIPGTQGMSCRFVGDTTNRCWTSPP
jgi:hypothetical protein